jgi:hypothetical protein
MRGSQEHGESKRVKRVRDPSDLPDLAAEYARLFAPLDDPHAELSAASPTHRRTVAFEWQVLSEVDDADESKRAPWPDPH